MAETGNRGAIGTLRNSSGLLIAMASCLMLAACSKMDSSLSDLLALQKSDPATGSITTGATTPADDGKAELAKATEYWGKVYRRIPRMRSRPSTMPATSRRKARSSSRWPSCNRRWPPIRRTRVSPASTAAWRLSTTMSPWPRSCSSRPTIRSTRTGRIVSARGTVLAKQNQYSKAIPLFERALQLAPEQPSVMSNLALAYAMEGNVEKAEPLLRRAAALGGDDARVNQNLALVLGLQGKYDEAKVAIARDLPPDRVASNVDYLQQMVKVDPKPMPATPIATPEKVAAQLKPATAPERSDEARGWTTSVAAAKQ